MGRSDPIILPWYERMIRTHCKPRMNDRVAFLGFSHANQLVNALRNDFKACDLYDLQLDNWNINGDDTIIGQYDLIVCTRCAYFACDINSFMSSIMSHLSVDGCAFIDWGYGTHFATSDGSFMVGWHDVKTDRFVVTTYANVSAPLRSGYWCMSLDHHPASRLFRDRIRTKGYDDNRTLREIISDEVPHLVIDDDIIIKPYAIDALCLWCDRPQLYVACAFRKGMHT